MIGSFRNKSLKRYWVRNDPSKINPAWVTKVALLLDALDAAVTPDEMDVATFGFHALKGDRAGRYAVTVSRNWRITFGWEGENAVDIDLDPHGAQAGNGGGDVRTRRQMRHRRRPPRDGANHRVPMGDGFIARDPQGAPESARGPDMQYGIRHSD